jgi:hypothetical protein
MVLSQRITNRALAAIPVGACLALSNNGFSRLTRPAATKPSSPSPADASNGLNGAAFEIARSRRQPSRCPGRSGGGSRSKKYEKGSELRVLGDCSFQNDPIAAPASVVHHHVPRKILRAVEGGGLLYEDRRVLTRVSRGLAVNLFVVHSPPATHANRPENGVVGVCVGVPASCCTAWVQPS